MPPHGSGVTGATHSHDPEYPEDNFNLYTQLDPTSNALNVTKPEDCIGIFKPHALRLNTNPHLISDADHEIIICARFISPVSVRKIIIMGYVNDQPSHPRTLKCYSNQDDIDFTSVHTVRPIQEFELPINLDGSIELITVNHGFSMINTLTFYFSSNHGDVDYTTIQYIGMQGDHTHHRREAVHATYEVLCTGHDHKVNDSEKAFEGA